MVVLCIATVFLLFSPDQSFGLDECATCHTMHNSLGGGGMTGSFGDGFADGQCMACHLNEDGSDAVNDNIPAPGVQHENNPLSSGGKYLAAGSFYFLTLGDEYAHNVEEFENTDDVHGLTPPGGITLEKFNCASCHLTKYQHHANQGGAYANPSIVGFADGTGIGQSYRFLSGATGGGINGPNGIKGGEDGDWEFTSGPQEHNVYVADNDYNSTAQDTITYVCNLCHGDFHGSANAGSPSAWIRHPTDFSLNDGNNSEYASYGTYKIITPIAVDNAISNNTGDELTMTEYNSLDTGGTNLHLVTCISCHRAHGSEHPDMLRWSYSTQMAGSGSGGCFNCHTSKGG
jgi:predicted CXXCH cytochrome family protein